ncbi:4-phosphoerythronate dehydrogenase [Legionella fallonii]|uniref:Erythronate-4-phosphate dehydrogenase n=1 Tax=Legionella fallonii LLAP-10 TaxID=1212491 RepID=A0A098G364_9GAMM|nr:4-phosphoerythronate dehydrogenase [Legionella fallonii]CEG56429.1 Erythronate-4-phosphate dehydrogenase [Legionella fallonii LLAP-10]
MKILADASLPGLDIAFPKPFILSLYSNEQELCSMLDGQDILLCRSTLKVNQELLKEHHLKCVATATSGTDHLDHFFLRSQNIPIIDAKGSNASSVADYVIASLAYLDQQHLITSKHVGIIGMGEVGKRVYARLKAANFHIQPYDPPREQWDQQFKSCELEQLLAMDILCIHAELHNIAPYPSLNLLNKDFLDQLKPGCIIINAARGGIVNEEALLKTQQNLIYCTDVFLNEPSIDKRIVEKATLCTPHIAGHSLEAKWTAVAVVSEKLHELIGLPVPQFDLPPQDLQITLNQTQSWQELILSLYNPFAETSYLKQAHSKEEAFLKLRKQHQKRHDFSLYSDLITDRNIKSLMGA